MKKSWDQIADVTSLKNRMVIIRGTAVGEQVLIGVSV
jgi:hypothetical protein